MRMELSDILALTCYILIVSNGLSIGAGASKKTSFRISGTYLKAVGFLNAIIGLGVGALFQFYFINQEVSETLIRIGTVGGALQGIIGMGMCAFGIMFYPYE